MEKVWAWSSLHSKMIKGTKDLALVAYLSWIRYANTNPNFIYSESWRLTCTTLLNCYILLFSEKMKNAHEKYQLRVHILHPQNMVDCNLKSMYALCRCVEIYENCQELIPWPSISSTSHYFYLGGLATI